MTRSRFRPCFLISAEFGLPRIRVPSRGIQYFGTSEPSGNPENAHLSSVKLEKGFTLNLRSLLDHFWSSLGSLLELPGSLLEPPGVTFGAPELTFGAPGGPNGAPGASWDHFWSSGRPKWSSIDSESLRTRKNLSSLNLGPSKTWD